MTPEDLAALLAEETHTFKCGGCGANWVVPKSGAALLFHFCPLARARRESYDWRTPRQRHDDERRQWATEVFGAFESALGDRAYLDGDPDPTPDPDLEELDR